MTLKRLFISALIVPVTFTIATLRTGHATGSLAAARPNGEVTAGQSYPQYEQTQNQAPGGAPKSLSPGDILIFIHGNPGANLKDLWRLLDIYPDFGDGEDRDPTVSFLDSCSSCKAEMFEEDLDDEPGKEIILLIEDMSAESCRYLIYKSLSSSCSDENFKLIGHIDWDSCKYRRPHHSVVISGGRTWLLVEVADGSGSGFSHYSYRLFKVESSGIKELLSFPSEGFLLWRDLFSVQTFSSRVINCSSNDTLTMVEVEFYLSYSRYDSSDNSFSLWSKKQRAVYAGDGREGKLALDPAKSDISEQEIKDVYKTDELSCSGIFRYNLASLKKIAAGRSRKRKAWLREYLNQCEGSPEKQELEELLNQTRE